MSEPVGWDGERMHSSDETDLGWGDEPPRDDDERLRAERPPHHEVRSDD